MPLPLVERVRIIRRLPEPRERAAIRSIAGASQQDIADELGVCRVTVARWEIGTRTPRSALAVRYVLLLEALADEAAWTGS